MFQKGLPRIFSYAQRQIQVKMPERAKTAKMNCLRLATYDHWNTLETTWKNFHGITCNNMCGDGEGSELTTSRWM